MDQSTEETQEQRTRSYSSYFSGAQLTFDPLKELNLPANYEEVVARFRKLQGGRAMEVLN
ncbi:MAG: hypothetical protein QM724_09620 [Flavobacteriales bacterium]